jgi:branched-chain amino acid transport system substrate-binding protein
MTKDAKTNQSGTGPAAGQSRRWFLKTALASSAAAAAAATTTYLVVNRKRTPSRDSSPIVIGHQCDLTGGFSSWGYWHDKCANAAVRMINEEGGIAGRRVELATEDTESNPAEGARKLRALIQRRKASFVVGSVHSGIMLASIPIATELKTPYFSTGEATEATGSKGSRYAFRTGTDTYALAAAGVPWAMENLGKTWTMIFPDYAWGHSHHQEHRKLIEAAGGKVNDPISVPLDTKDLVPYLARIPENTEVLFSVFFGALSVAFYTQAKSMRLEERMKMYSVAGTLEAIDPRDIGGATEGVYFLENFPRPLEYKNDSYHKRFIELVDVDPIYAKENGSSKVMAKSHAWQAFENFFVLKEAIEASGWQRPKDTPGVIQALEGLTMENSMAHPQGAKLLRAEDHSGMIDCYISRVEESKFVLKKRIPREELMAKLPPRFDFRKRVL